MVLVAVCTFAQGPAGTETVSLGFQMPDATITAKTGIGTANACAEARLTRKNASDYCMNWRGGAESAAALARCAKETLAENPNPLRFSADCTAGKLTPLREGLGTHTFAGMGRDGGGQPFTRWRNPDGNIVGTDRSSGGSELSQQWAILCPGPVRIAPASSAAKPAPAAAQPKPAPPPPPVCGDTPNCSEVNPFAATILDFRTSTSGSTKLVTANIRFQNKLARPIILGYVSGSGVTTDDQGNRYLMSEDTGLRGMGSIRSNSVDPKFVIGPGETKDARLEYAWTPRGHEIFGTAYDLEFTVREILPVANQLRIGSEHPLQFRGLGLVQTSSRPVPQPPAAVQSVAAASAPAAAVPAAVPDPAAAAPAPAPVPAAADPCAGIPRCYAAGPFVAQVAQLTSTVAGYYQTLRINVRFRNVAAQPVVLAYKSGTAAVIDNHGSRYRQARNAVTGMGVSQSGAVGADFILRPGETRNATFEVVATRSANTLIGTGFTFDVAVVEVELLPQNQVRVTNEHSLNFQNLTASNPGAGAAPAQSLSEATQQLKGIFSGKKK
jgi:hypothetical protein